MTDWKGDDYIKQLEKQMGDNLEKAAVFLKERIKEAVNRSQPYTISHGQGTWYKGEEPSQPGEPPKKIRGDLQRSIAHEMSPDRQTAKVGSNLDYALYLEVGTSKMAPRPFLRSTLLAHQDTIAKIVSTGSK